MGAVKKYFAREFRKDMLQLEHEAVSDFYLCSFMRNRSSIPLLLVRGLLLLGCIGIVVSSFILTVAEAPAGKWFIYLTHWGLLLITATSALAFAVSCRAYFKGPIDGTFGLPWYVKVYWVLYEITITIAFFITVFYWTLLSGGDAEGEYAVDPVLDLFIHGVNSMVMFCLLVTSRQPVNILHFYMPIVLGLIYTLFTVIYHFAGGTDLLGNPWIYPMMDWANPGSTVIMVVVTAIGIVVVHLVVVGIAAARNALSRCSEQ
ncbi:protein rolling stone-like [Aricia agestis]|uniref:protein rolling stone-like n=1 Tax=Aricia agestis TaxID=91739 RepID=UPI001C2025A9|nr:protein rolling stone-like [Aricia agestis]